VADAEVAGAGTGAGVACADSDDAGLAGRAGVDFAGAPPSAAGKGRFNAAHNAPMPLLSSGSSDWSSGLFGVLCFGIKR
jgi:hypothetical protein